MRIVLRTGGKLVTMPSPRVARAIDVAVGERLDKPILIAAHGQRLDSAAEPRVEGRRRRQRSRSVRRSGP
jgi:hypothetical protein